MLQAPPTRGLERESKAMAYLNPPEPTSCRVPIKRILGFIIRTYRKVRLGVRALGFGVYG